MKLIEKKCPNCGAGLKFDKNDTEVTCEYCKKSYVIQRDSVNENNDFKSQLNLDKAGMSDYYSLVQKGNNFANVVSIFIFVGAFLFIIFMVVGIVEVRNKMNNDNFFDDVYPSIEVKKDKYVTEISQIDEKSLGIFHKETKNTLDKWTGKIWSDVSETEWTYVGMYLLVNKDDGKKFGEINYLFDVYKKTYTGEYDMDVYGAVMYTNLKLLEDNTVNNSYYGTPCVPMQFVNGGTSSFIYGYEGNEELYNKIIRTKRDEYKILATDGLYLEN